MEEDETQFFKGDHQDRSLCWLLYTTTVPSYGIRNRNAPFHVRACTGVKFFRKVKILIFPYYLWGNLFAFTFHLAQLNWKIKIEFFFLNSKMISFPFSFLLLFVFSSSFSSLSTCNHILLGKSEIHVTWTTPKGFKNECGFSLLPNWLFLEKDENKPGSFYRYDWHLLR